MKKKKLLFVSLSVFAVVCLIAFLIPFFFSLNQFRPLVVSKFYEATGYKMDLKGDINFRVLPTLQIDINDVAIRNSEVLSSDAKASSPLLLAEVKKIAAYLDLWDLLRGKVTIHKIKATSPRVFTDGWDSSSIKANKPTGVMSASSLLPKVVQNTSTPTSIQITKVMIVEGEVVLSRIESKKKISSISIELFPNISSTGLTHLTFSGKAFYGKTEISTHGEIKLADKGYTIDTELSSLGVDGSFKGSLALAPFSIRGEFTGKGVMENLCKDRSDSLQGLSPDSPFLFTNKVLIERDKLTIPQFLITAGPYSLKGNGSYGFSTKKIIVDLMLLDKRLKDASITLNVSDVLPGGGGTEGAHVSIRGNNVGAFFPKGSFFSKYFGTNFSLSGVADVNEKSIRGSQLFFQSGDLLVQGALTYYRGDNPKFAYDFVVPHLSALENRSGLQQLTSFVGDSCTVKGESTLTLPQVQTKLILSSPFLRLGITNSADFLTGSTQGTINLLSISQTSPLASFVGTTPFENIQFKVSAQRVDLTFGSSHKLSQQNGATGKIYVSFDKQQTKIGGNLFLDKLSINNPPHSKSAQVPRHQKMVIKEERVEKNAPLDLFFLKTINLDLSISINKIMCGSVFLDNFQASVKSSPNSLIEAPFQGVLFGGDLNGKLSLSYASTPFTLETVATLKGSHVRHLDIKNNKFSLEEGALHGSMDLKTTGMNMDDCLGSLAGPFSLQVKDGVVRGFDLEKAVKSIRATDTLEGILGMIDASFSNGQSHFHTLNLNLMFKNGVGTLHDSGIWANSASIIANGSASFLPSRCDIFGEIKLDIPDVPSIGYKVLGPLDNPDATINTDRLESYITSKILPSIFGTLGKDGEKVAKALTNLVPSAPSQKTSQKKRSSADTNPVENLVQSGLNLLGL